MQRPSDVFMEGRNIHVVIFLDTLHEAEQDPMSIIFLQS